MTKFDGVQIIGSGLIGTSIALCLREKGIEVELRDINEANLSLARDLVSSVKIPKPDLIIVATPPEAVFSVLLDAIESNPASIFIDISGIKSNLLLQVAKFPHLNSRFCSVHPMAGREVSGPQSARSDLFESRAWVVCPTDGTAKPTIEMAKELGLLLGSTIYEMPGSFHDPAIAAISHIPQVLSSLLAGTLLQEKSQVLDIAGQGLRDMTRLADSDSNLWVSLLAGNSKEVVPRLINLAQSLQSLADAISNSDLETIAQFIKNGNEGKARIPGKHGAKKRDYTYLPIVISDEPGQLAEIFNECAKVSVNVEDIQLEHSPGQQTGLITLALSEQDAAILKPHLENQGWLAHEPRK